MTKYLPLARILLRYLFGALASAGILPSVAADVMAADPDLAMVGAAAIGAVATEVGYFVAKSRGGAT